MFLLKWYREYLSIKNEKAANAKELAYCDSCETLKVQLALANEERKMLIAKLTDKPIVEETKRADTSDLKPLYPQRLSFNARRQMLEAEDRAAAKVLKNKQDEMKDKKENSGKPLTVSDIEKEIGVNEA